MNASVLHDNIANVPSVNHDPVLLDVNNALMEHWRMFHINGLQGCWAPLPPTQAITTGSDAHIAQELGAMRRVQGEVTANKKKVPQKGWRVVLVTKLLSLARVPSKEDPLYTTLAVGKGVTQVSILTQNTFVAYC